MIEDETEKLRDLKFLQEGKQIYASDYLKRPNTSYTDLSRLCPEYRLTDISIGQNCAVNIKYEGYIARQKVEINRNKKDEELPLPEKINYEKITALSIEARENLSIARPQNLRQASRVPGVTPAAISILKVQIKAIKNNKEIARDGA